MQTGQSTSKERGSSRRKPKLLRADHPDKVRERLLALVVQNPNAVLEFNQRLMEKTRSVAAIEIAGCGPLLERLVNVASREQLNRLFAN